MNRTLAEKHDQFLVLLAGAFKEKKTVSHEDLLKAGDTMGLSNVETEIVLDIFVADGLLNKMISSNKMDEEIEYSSNPKLTRQIYFNGGYKKIARKKSIEDSNNYFTYVRHWIWFFIAVASILFNIYLLFFYSIND